MKVLSALLLSAGLAFVAPSLALAQDNAAKIKALADEKAIFDAQAARDQAEANRVRAAAELANAKAAAANNDKAALDAKAAQDVAEANATKAASDLATAKYRATEGDTSGFDVRAARDNAEAAAAKAASELAKAKAAVTLIDSANAKGQLDAETALTGAKVGAQTAEYAALKSVFGAAPSIGSDGNITITEATTGLLLESKSGSLKATASLSAELCKALKDAGVMNAFLAPTDLERKILASSFVLKEFKDLVDGTNDDAVKKVVTGSVGSQISPAAALSALSMLQYGAGALQSVAKLFRSDYAVAVADGRRETWLEYFMAAQCPQQLPFANVEGKIRIEGFENEISQLQDLAKFVDDAAAKKGALQRDRDEKAQAIAKKETAKVAITQTEKDALDNANAAYELILKYDGLVARTKSLLDTVSSKTDLFIDALVWDRFNQEPYKSQPRLSVTFTTQDGQVSKTNWLTGKSIYGRSSGELIYRVVVAEGAVKTAGYLLATNSDGKLDFGATMKPVANGLALVPPSGR